MELAARIGPPEREMGSASDQEGEQTAAARRSELHNNLYRKG
jgi:hypothetical protein